MPSIFERVRAVNLPDDEYLVSGSAILEALGIRETHDMDFVVSPKLFAELKARGWTQHPKYAACIENVEEKTEALQSLVFTKENYTLQDLLPGSTVINGISFLSLEQLIHIKRQLGREKDLADIALIEKYLSMEK